MEALALERVLTGWYAVRPPEGALEARRRALDALRAAVRELRAACGPSAYGSYGLRMTWAW